MEPTELIKKLLNQDKSFTEIIEILYKYFPDVAYELEERAAIKEYDGNIERFVAEHEALIEYKIKSKL